MELYYIFWKLCHCVFRIASALALTGNVIYIIVVILVFLKVKKLEKIEKTTVAEWKAKNNMIKKAHHRGDSTFDDANMIELTFRGEEQSEVEEKKPVTFLMQGKAQRHSEKKNQMSFEKGDVIEIVEKANSKWYKGILRESEDHAVTGKVLYVPVSYLKSCAPASPGPVAVRPS